MGSFHVTPQVVAPLLAALVACDSPATVVAGPHEISSRPQEIPFLGPVPVTGPRRELCLDFEPPGQSRMAGSVRAVLLTTDGRRDTLGEPGLDRRGGNRVCLIASAPSAELAAELRHTRYRAVELSTLGARLQIKAIRWWSGR